MPARQPPREIQPSHRRELLDTAVRAALDGGRIVSRNHDPLGQELIRKGTGDFVTAVDLEVEDLLRKTILEQWPEHGFLGEEHPPHALDADFVWVVDPIDGTSNFGRGLGTFAVSVACLYRGAPLATAVHCFPEDVTYHAALDLGAFRGTQRLELAATSIDDSAILGLQWHRGVQQLPYIEDLLSTGSRIRNLGCTVVQLCDVATGRLDGNVQEQGRLWDFAAAALLVTEAGGRFTSWAGDDIFPVPTLEGVGHLPSIAAHPSIHGSLCELLGPWQDRLDVPPR